MSQLTGRSLHGGSRNHRSYITTESLQVLVFSTTSHTGSSYKIRKKPPVSSAACELNLSGFAGSPGWPVAGDQSQVYPALRWMHALRPYDHRSGGRDKAGNHPFPASLNRPRHNVKCRRDILEVGTSAKSEEFD
jgi:hypothetical protein